MKPARVNNAYVLGAALGRWPLFFPLASLISVCHVQQLTRDPPAKLLQGSLCFPVVFPQETFNTFCHVHEIEISFLMNPDHRES